MLSEQKFINQSLELNLFSLRIMKEHSIFLEAAFAIKDMNLIHHADALKNEFTRLLSRAIYLSEGVLPPEALLSNDIVTKYTMAAEKATQFITGISIDSNLTSMENGLSPNMDTYTSMSSSQVFNLNHQSILAISAIIDFKSHLLKDVLSCKVFTTAYPLLIDHILREALLFRNLLIKLQNGIEINVKKDMLDQEIFWNRIMSEHSYFIRGLLDPTEVELITISNNFGKEFETLTKEAIAMNKASMDLSNLTDSTLKETIKLRDFKAQGTEGLLGCKIKSIIVPLLGDHVLREANHYIHLLKSFSET